jgi:3-carboxy-cis,cis-muconate cycloisomerase
MSTDLLRSAFSPTEVDRLTDSSAWVQAMLDFEAALARAQARLGLVPAAAAEAISQAARAELFDPVSIEREAAKGGNPAIPLVKQLTAQLPASAAAYVHWGATSQDVIDSGLMLIIARSLDHLLEELLQIQVQCAALAQAHRTTVMAGRTLMQQALPVSFGLKAAGWLSQLQRARAELAQVRREALAVQFGGAVGTLASLGEQGPAVVRELARELDLAEPELPWHTARDRPVRVCAALGLVGGALGKLAQDVMLMMQTEVAEVAEPSGPGRGGSSTMPHKRNPVASTLTLAAVRRLHALMPLAYGAMLQEHERAAGAWHTEWSTLAEALRLTASAAANVRFLTDGLSVNASRMRANLDLTHGLLMAEAVMMALAPRLGRDVAHARVQTACEVAVAEKTTLQAVLGRDQALTAQIGPEQLQRLFDPAGYLGAAEQFIERVLAACADLGERHD